MDFGWFLQDMIYEAVNDLETADPDPADIPPRCTADGCLNPGAHSKCLDCVGANYICDTCMLRTHRHVPLHQISRWENGSFSRVNLRSIGMRIPLGHSDCAARSTEQHFIIVDTDKPHNVAIAFCDCGVGGTRAAQLVAARLYPSSYERPRAAITFRMVMAANADRSPRPSSPSSSGAHLSNSNDISLYIISIQDDISRATHWSPPPTAMSNRQEENDDWALAFGNFFDLYFNPANAAQESDVNRDNDLIPAGEPRSWDDASWQSGDPGRERQRSSADRFEIEFTPHLMTDGEQAEREWASARYMHDVMAGREEMGAGMRETGDYHDYLLNRRHTFTPEEQRENDRMWAHRRQARIKRHTKALKRKATACAAADKKRLAAACPACPETAALSGVWSR
ncbi:hypothetical protein C8F04DRAFT_1259547 [Mycena alexandri]|uniref:CxC2-like cysteine cluster KDZ transposase-associated domain-containing protein n=1 Tax=Mycena alexandri TaxID=1745969 RepID=A0AAD6SW07_9AGAR|nr:hypothetical protein C8F04DRAFT_1259547 [Mycena alexandri]